VKEHCNAVSEGRRHDMSLPKVGTSAKTGANVFHIIQVLVISASAFSCRIEPTVVISRLVEAANYCKLGLRFCW
jgi:hypothetical protein